MQTIEYKTIDKTSWPAGPWQTEPDKKQWPDEETGLPCLIVRGPVGALCGYVGVSPEHPWFGKDYTECTLPQSQCRSWCDHSPENLLDVHGGLTFANSCSNGPENVGICHKPSEGETDDIWWFGFACADFDDVRPRPSLVDGTSLSNEESTYRDLAYVTAEVTKLAAQLASVD